MKYQILILSASLFVLATGCTQSVPQAQAKLCTSLAEFKTALATLQSLSPNSTVGDLKKAQTDARQAWDKVQADAQALGNARVDVLDQSYKDLDKTINSVPNNATLSEGANAIQGKVAAVAAARDQLYSGLQCQ